MADGRKLRQLRVLPPIVIARFGSSPTPMENYELTLPVGKEDGKPTTNYRVIMPAETLMVDDVSGAVAAVETPPCTGIPMVSLAISPVPNPIRPSPMRGNPG